MKTNTFTPEKSFELIDQAIKDARNQFEKSGFAFILWGAAIALCCFAQFYLLQMERHQQSWYPYVLLPLLGIFAYLYYNKKKEKSHNLLSRISSTLWVVTGLNISIVAFGFNGYLESNLISIILILLGIATFIESSLIRSQLLFVSGILLNLGAYIAWFTPWKYQPLLMGILSLVALLIPGILLHLKEKNQDV